MSIEDYNTATIEKAFDYLDEYNSSSDTNNETSETVNKCYIIDEIDDFTTQNVRPGEICTIETAQSYGIFGKDKYFNNVLWERDAINTYSDNSDENLAYSLCTVDEKTAYTNCVLSTKNPWKSLSSDGSYCMLPVDIPLPDNLRYVQDSTKIQKPPNIPYTISTKDICKERWYDWFSIPDYHLGNMYSSNETTGKCMKPCDLGKIPGEDDGKCINRESYSRGYYKDDFYYLPISLIFLLGSTKESLLKRHKREISGFRSHVKNISIDNDIYNNIMTDDVTQNNIYNSIKNDLRNHIHVFLNQPFDDTYIMEPSNAIQSLSSIQNIMSYQNILDAYNIAAKFFVLSENKDNEEKFNVWKTELADINNYDITDPRFYKQLLILKKACNVLFDGKNSYSRDKVLYRLNIDLQDTDLVKQPLIFKITEEDSVMAMSKNIAHVPVDKIDSMEEANKRRSDKLMSMQTTDNTGDGSGDSNKLTQVEEDNDDENTLSSNRGGGSSGSTSNILAQIVAITAIVLFLILVTMIVIILGNFFWYYIAEFLNMIIISFAYLLYGLRDLFRMKWTPSKLNMDITELQKTFINKKIMTDLTRIKT